MKRSAIASARRSGLALLAAIGIGAVLPAQMAAPETQVLQVTVTSASGRSVYLDRGRSDGLQVGTLVKLFPPGAGQVEVEVRSVSSNSSRAELQAGVPAPPVGTRGEVEVAIARSDASVDTPRRPVSPQHPPWSRQEAQRTADQPLLVPSFGQRPEDRPMQLSGRLFGYGQWNADSSGTSSSDYFLGRVGTSLRADNPLGFGGRAQFAGELDRRLAQLDDAPDQSDGRGRIDLLSYAVGIEEYAPYRFEAGRFYSVGVPELGLLDGLEATANYQGGLRIGAGAASYPVPFPSRDSGDDLGLHVFTDYQSGKDRAFAAALAYQKTWHRGTADRDLLVLRMEGRPGDGVWLYGSAKIDFYSGRDTVKGSGPELTEFLGQARCDGADAGLGATLSHYTWPELRRQEYQSLPLSLLTDGKVDRAGLSGYVRPSRNVRLSGRVDFWRDQDRDGTAGEIATDITELFGPGSAFYAALFRSDGSYSSGPGARLRARKNLGDHASASAGYSWHRYDVQGLLSGDQTLTRQSIDVGLDLYFGDWDLNCTFERWFGDAEDSFSFGVYAQYRF